MLPVACAFWIPQITLKNCSLPVPSLQCGPAIWLQLQRLNQPSGQCAVLTQSKMHLLDVTAMWLPHLSLHWSPGLIRLIWLFRRVSPSPLTTAPCASLPKLRIWSKRRTFPDRGEDLSSVKGIREAALPC